MGFISSLATSKLSPIFKYPLAPNLSRFGKFGGFTCNDQALLFSRTHKRVYFPRSNLELSQVRNYHYGPGYYPNGGGRVTKHGVRKWGSRVCLVGVGMVVYSVLVCWNAGHWETVPYTNRNHFVPSTNYLEFKYELKSYNHLKQYLANQNDPTSQRFVRIFGVMLDTMANDLKVGSMSLSCPSPLQLVWEKEKGEEMSELREIRERKVGRDHLNGMHWKAVVLDSDYVLHSCLPNGEFIITTGLLKICESDDEIAAVIGHEVGHVVARHISETLIFDLWLKELSFVFKCIPGFEKLLKKFGSYVISRPFSTRQEVEADQIGVMLMASAGYDPRKALDVQKKLDSCKIPFKFNHRSGRKRAKLLAKGSFMQEATALYNRVTTRPKVDHETDISTSSD